MKTAERLEHWPIDKLVPYAGNPRTHSDAQVAQIAASIREFGFANPILVDGEAGVIAGHGRLLAARKLQLPEVPVIVLSHLSKLQRKADIDNDCSDEEKTEDLDQPPVEPVTRTGDIWTIGKHRLICGDCREPSDIERLFEGAKAGVVVTSPPYASQREYDASSGFKPIAPEKYCDWFRDVATNIASVLAPDGSYFLDIKEHADDGQRSLYVKDLTLAHVREWGWRFVDEFCWRNTANGVPGGWPNRFKNAWEPVFHFTRTDKIKFRPEAVSHESDDVVVYSALNPKAPSGSGLLGCGADKVSGMARPSNVIEVKAEGGQGDHSAPFPRALVEFFLKAFSDARDIAFDPFLGSGTTMAAAHVLKRIGYGVEISPAYCDVILRRMEALTGTEPVLAETGKTLSQVADERGIGRSK